MSWAAWFLRKKTDYTLPSGHCEQGTITLSVNPGRADALETGDAACIAKARGLVAGVKGITDIATATGLLREQPLQKVRLRPKHA